MKNYTKKEFACHGANCCCHSYPVDQRLVESVNWLQEQFSHSLILTSGFRCRKHNKKVEGAENSFHTLGVAADLACPEGITPQSVADFAESIPFLKYGGLGIYDWGVHIDIRDNIARWDKRTQPVPECTGDECRL